MYPVETVCIEVLQKGLQIIGEGWYEEPSRCSRSTLRRRWPCGASMPCWVRRRCPRTGRILMACPPGEEHVFGQALLQLLLRRRGWETIYLGSNVPIERLESSVEMVRPHLVILTAQRLQTAAALKDMAELLHQKGVPVGFGGRIFTEIESLRDRIPGHFLGETIKGALDHIQDLVPMSPPMPTPKPIPAVFRSALSDFQINLLPINARVSQLMHTDPITPSQLSSANLNLAQNVVSALKLGNLDLLSFDIDWTKAMLDNHRLSHASLARWLKAYAQATAEYLSHEGQPIVVWLENAGAAIDAATENGFSGGSQSRTKINGSKNGLHT
ncbi:MAG: cobalamin B12-binding domain-containing protein [Caldilineaceae bacterium]